MKSAPGFRKYQINANAIQATNINIAIRAFFEFRSDVVHTTSSPESLGGLLVAVALTGHFLARLTGSTVAVHTAETGVLDVAASPGLALIVFCTLFSNHQPTTTSQLLSICE